MADVLERGDIYFLYRPRVDHSSAGGLEDVQRFFVILSPRGASTYRLIVIGRKKLPEVHSHRDRAWGSVGKVGSRAEDLEDELDALTYPTKTRVERSQHPLQPLFEGKWS